MTEQVKNQFREDEISLIRHWDKKREEWITNVFVRVGGRLRVAHEANETLDIKTEIYKYDENIAVVIARCKTESGCFTGIGMSSVERDKKIAPAILELAETRAISRSLRFAGYGVEFCSAEEIQDNFTQLENGKGQNQKQLSPETAGNKNGTRKPGNDSGNSNNRQAQNNNRGNGNGNIGSSQGNKRIEVGFDPVDNTPNVYKPNFNVRETHNQETSRPASNGNGQKKRQLSMKQYEYIRSLGKKAGYDYSALSNMSLDLFGVILESLTTADASNFIAHLQNGTPVPIKPRNTTPVQQTNA